MPRLAPRLIILAAMYSFASPAAALVEVEWVTVGDPGNACETQTAGCFGSVAQTYRISKYEVSNADYAEFLNAVAASDPQALYNTSMGSGLGGITRSGTSGSFTYSTIVDREDMPVNYVTFWDAARYANWLHNGQPTGPQSAATTEDGAYALTTTGISENSVTRNENADVFIPSEDEWYKAAYYDTSTLTYFDFPAGSDTATTCSTAGSIANTANCDSAVGDLTSAGSYTGAASPAGTFDQGGNVSEWNETIQSILRGRRGGHLTNDEGFLAASFRGAIFAGSSLSNVGFRVASSAPAPQVPALGPVGIALLAALVGAFGWQRVRSARLS